MPVWDYRIVLDSTDITSLVTGVPQVEEGESVSALTDFTYHPASGAQDPDGLLLQTVTIDVDLGSGWVRLFTGVVLRATWSPKDRRYDVRASDRLQEYFRALGTESAVRSAITGSVYSEALQGEPPDDLWEYAERCMETVEKDIHLDRTGTLALVDWAAKATADYTISSSGLHAAGEFTLEKPDADSQVNSVEVVYEYRVQRNKVASFQVDWSVTPCAWLVGDGTNGAASHTGFTAPTKQLVDPLLTGSSWYVPSAVYAHPETGSHTDYCYTGHNWTNSDSAIEPNIILEASATGYRAFSQPIRETYTITIDAAAAQTYYGATVTARRAGSYDVPADDWPQGDPQPQTGWDTDTAGDDYEDQEDETTRSADLQACYQIARARIRGDHRQTSLTVRADLRTDITLASTVAVSGFGVSAKGKVRRLVHALSDPPHSLLTLAISRGNGGTDDSWTAPSRPDTSDPETYWENLNGGTYTYPTRDTSVTLPTHIGNDEDADAVPSPDTRLGWITNFSSAIGSPVANQIYDLEFRVEWPEIESEAATEILEDVTASFDVSVPHDTLTIS